MLNTDFSSVEKVFIYTGDEGYKGVYYDGVEKIKYRLEALKPGWAVAEVTEPAVTPELFLTPENTLFIVPGAKAGDLDDQLGDKIPLIRQFVEKGGGYFGICGGAYWASRRVLYNAQGKTIDKTRELAFFRGIAKGPIQFPNYEKNRPHGVVKIFWRNLPKALPTLSMGGGSFVGNEKVDEFEVLAKYQKPPTSDLENAIIKCKVGKGIAILCGPHLEWDADDLDVLYNKGLFIGHKWVWIKEGLRRGDNRRHDILRELFNEFLDLDRTANDLF